jgi:competence ComEA-like helix-hairpin-helix protein
MDAPARPTPSTSLPTRAQWAGAFLLGVAATILFNRIFNWTDPPWPSERERPVIVRAQVQDSDNTETEYVPVPSPATKEAGTSALTTRSKKVLADGELINVNTATVEELQRLPGIGPVMAQRINLERSKGRFLRIEDLRRVSGIGIKTLEKLRPHVTVGPSPSQENASRD